MGAAEMNRSGSCASRGSGGQVLQHRDHGTRADEADGTVRAHVVPDLAADEKRLPARLFRRPASAPARWAPR